MGCLRGGGAPKSASFDDDTLPFVSAHSIPVNLLGERMCTVRLVRFHELDLFRSRRHTRPVIIKMDGRSRRSSRRRRWRLCGRCFQRFLLIALLRFALRGRLLLGHLTGIEEDSRCWSSGGFTIYPTATVGPRRTWRSVRPYAVATGWSDRAHPKFTNLLTDTLSANRCTRIFERINLQTRSDSFAHFPGSPACLYSTLVLSHADTSSPKIRKPNREREGASEADARKVDFGRETKNRSFVMSHDKI